MNTLAYSPTNRELTGKEVQQEENLTYVAFTRSKENLYLVPYTNGNDEHTEVELNLNDDYVYSSDIDYGF